MYKSLILLLLATLALSKLTVYHPTSLRDEIDRKTGAIHSSIANFGHIPYGNNIVGKLWYDEDNRDGCGDFTIDINGDGDPDASPSPIVMVERGNCSFVKKVRNVEHAGGALAVIIDNKAGEIVEQVIMVDDGTGSSIKIPSMLISKADGKKICKLYCNRFSETI